MKSAKINLLAFALIVAFFEGKSQEISAFGAWGYDEYKAEFLETTLLKAESAPYGILFQTRMQWDFGVQFMTRKSYIIRPRMVFGRVRLPESGISGNNQLDPRLNEQSGFAFEGALDLGKSFPVIADRLNLIGCVGFGMGGGIGQYYLEENTWYRYKARVFSLQPSIQLELAFKFPLRIAIEQRHEIGIQYYRQTFDTRYGDDYWRYYTTAKSWNYIPPMLRVSWVIQDLMNKNIPVENQ